MVVIMDNNTRSKEAVVLDLGMNFGFAEWKPLVEAFLPPIALNKAFTDPYFWSYAPNPI